MVPVCALASVLVSKEGNNEVTDYGFAQALLC